MVDTDAMRLYPLRDLHDVAGTQRPHPGGDSQSGAHAATPVGEELDRFRVRHPLMMGRQVGGRLPHPGERSLDVD